MAGPEEESPQVWGPDTHKTPEARLRQQMLNEIGQLHGEYLESTEDSPPAPEYEDGGLWYGIINGPPEAEHEFMRKAGEVIARYDKLQAETKRRRAAEQVVSGEPEADLAEDAAGDQRPE